MVFSFRYVGVIRISFLKVLFCRMQSAFYRSQRDIELFCNLCLRHIFPKVKVQDLLIFIIELCQSRFYGICNYRRASIPKGSFF